MPGISASSSPAGPKINTTTSSFTLHSYPGPLNLGLRAAAKLARAHALNPFQGITNPTDTATTITPTRAQPLQHSAGPGHGRHRQAPSAPNTFCDHFHQRVAMKQTVNNHRKEQLMRDRLSVLAKTKAKFEAIQRHKASVESSVEAFGGLSLMGEKAKSKEQSLVLAGENVKHAVGGAAGAGGQVANAEMDEEEEDSDVDEYIYLDEDKHTMGGTGRQVPNVATREEESLEDLDVDEYLYLDDDFDGREM
ncbi:unnamed protein product [Sordaria macrospora k-hell]|uniref:WGS project CABT00000000 data, contig 2.24 n=2 Tax=Sordaria macrospora TaxID=5147 RepID=F7W3E5_SORMK|nr:uncharacterized protein SMAC_05885 [Sordaria macrospora k-hell]CCC12147.1 unnamed protein product [Sordaria macrospora k-hell]